jgi:hypothetical protein
MVCCLHMHLSTRQAAHRQVSIACAGRTQKQDLDTMYMSSSVVRLGAICASACTRDRMKEKML